MIFFLVDLSISNKSKNGAIKLFVMSISFSTT
jgi:hypothetical protein